MSDSPDKDSIAGPLIVAAAMLSVAVLGAGYFLAQSIDRSSQTLAGLSAAIEKMPAARAAAPSRPSRPGRPDPNQRYEVDLAGAPTIGGGNQAAVTIVEWSDFQCPYCKRVVPTLEQIRREYGDDVRIVFKHLALPMHRKAEPAHIAAEAAHRQGKFWEMHDKIFESPRQLSSARFLQYAKEIGLDVDRYKADIASDSVKSRVRSDAAQASSLGVTGTPAFFVNGRFLSGAQPFAAFKRIIDEELKDQQG